MIDVRPADLTAALKAVLPHASTDWTLPQICAVHFTVVGTDLHVAATDRYTLGIYRVPATSDDNVVPHEFETTLSAKDVKQLQAALKAQPKNLQAVRLDKVDGAVAVGLAGQSLRFTAAEGTFPSYRQLVDPALEAAVASDPAGYATGYNPALLAKFKEACPKGDTVVLWPRSAPNKPTLVTAGDYFVGLIMRINPPGPAWDLPTWLNASTTQPSTEEGSAA